VTELPDPDALLADAPRVAEALHEAGWSSAALDELLGPNHRTHLDRDELSPLLRRTRGGTRLEQLTRALVLGAPVDDGTLPASWIKDGRAVTRVQAVAHDGQDVTVPHDAGSAAAAVHVEQVLGVGAASLTLAAATPRTRVRRVLDLGTGAGIQALLAASHADTVVATDRNPRAVSYTRLAAALNGVEIDARAGDLLEPVAGEVFDLVVSNPPFVISPGRRYTYRDAGYDGDEVCRRLVQELPTVLAPGGHAVLLVNWLHLEGEDGDERVRSWFDGTGCDGWVVQRELATPEDYVTAWLRDTDETAFDALYDDWVEALNGVDAVAFGVVALHKRIHGRAPQVTLDEVDQPTAATWGEEVLAHFARRDLLEGDLMKACLKVREDVRLHQVATRTEDGWRAGNQLLQQEAGLRWTGGVDVYGATLLAACDGTQPLDGLVAVLAASVGLSVAEAAEQVLPVVRRLVEQGFLGSS
jgi:SAM-dependent methyltransferase